MTDRSDPFARGLDYLYEMRRLALSPEMVGLVHDLENRIPVCIWIGNQIDLVNGYLQQCLQACHNCFHPWQQKPIQIFATPLADAFRLEGLCNLKTTPITLLIDVGRVEPEDWLALVVHEYAHAQVGLPGHHQEFAKALAHLCLGLDYVPLPWKPELESQLRSYPYCRATANPLAFWRGETLNWRSRVLRITTL